MPRKQKIRRRHPFTQLVICFHPSDQINNETAGPILRVVAKNMRAVGTEDDGTPGGIHGNGLQCAEHIREFAASRGHDADIHSVKESSPEQFARPDALIVISPVYIGRPSGKVKKFLKKLNPSITDGNYAVILTGVDGNPAGSVKLEDVLSQKGWKPVREATKIQVKGVNGPLEEDYGTKLDSFVADVLQKLESQ